MSDIDRGTDRVGRRAKRFLSPFAEVEIWLQLVCQEATIAEAAAAHQVDRLTIMWIRTVAKEDALAALPRPSPGWPPRPATTNWRCQGDGGQAGAGKGGWG